MLVMLKMQGYELARKQVNWCKLEDQNSQSPAESGCDWHYHYLQCFPQDYSAQEASVLVGKP